MSEVDNSLVNTILTLLGNTLLLYIKSEIEQAAPQLWLDIASSSPCNRCNKSISTNVDVAKSLEIMLNHWDRVFKGKLGYKERTLIHRLIKINYQWTMQANFSTNDTYQLLCDTELLLKGIGAKQINTIQKHQEELRNILSPEQKYLIDIRDKLHELLDKIPFQNVSLLLRALTHASYIHENPGTEEDNERLEFLGDALLNFLGGEYLYQRYPDKREGELTPLRSRFVEKSQLAKFALSLNIGKWMRLGKGAEKDGGRTNTSLLSDAFEAIVGGYFLDSGIEAVRDFMEPFFDSVAAEYTPKSCQQLGEIKNHLDIKNRLQKWALANLHLNPQRQRPEYVTIGECGPDHAKQFTVEVRVSGKVYGVGKGHSKQDAQKAAAADALLKLGEQ